MAKIKVLGNSMTIKSDVKFDDIVKANKVAPEFTQLVKTADYSPFESEVIFVVATTEGVGSISPVGVCFDSKDSEGYAYLTLALPERNAEMDKKYFADKFMTEMVRLNEVELRIKEAAELINESIAAVTKDVEIIG